MTFGGTNNRGPSIAELQRFIRDKTTLVFTLSNGDKVIGQLRWFDETAFQIMPDSQQPFTILRSAILGYQKHGSTDQDRPRAKVAAIEKQPDLDSEPSPAPAPSSDPTP